MRSFKVWAASTVAAAALAVGGASANAELVYGITFDNNLFSFDSGSPQNILTGVYVSGLQPNEFIQGIDFRPLTNELYAIGSTNRMYVLNTTTGAATQVGINPFTPPLNGVAYGVDFNPTVDRIRVHSNANQNLRLNPITGAVAVVDPNLYYAAGDPGAGLDPNIVASAYTNNFAGATTTTLYSIDSVRDVLVRHQLGSGDPAGSFAEMVTIGPVGVPFGDYAGFDISPSGQAYVHWNNASGLFGTIDLSTGAVTSRGTMGGGFFVRDIAVVIPEPATLSLAGLATIGLLVRRRK